MKPRVRSGYALKRLDKDEGNRRWVLRDLSRDGYLRLSDNDAQLFELIDGTRSLVVPNIKGADLMTFSELLTAYDDVVGRARAGKLHFADRAIV